MHKIFPSPTAIIVPLVLVIMAPITVAHADTPEEQLAAASALFEAQKYTEAASRLDAFLAEYPKHDRAGAAAYALGRCRTELKQYDKAIPAYQKAVATKDASILTLSELGLGEAAINIRQFDKAAPALEAALSGTLKPQQAGVAWLWLGQADYELKRYDRSDEAYQHVIDGYPRADYADSALFGAGLAELKLKRVDDAWHRFRTILDRYPRSEDRAQAQFLLAQIDLDAKHFKQARSGFEALLNGSDTGAATRAQAEDGLIQCLLAQGDYDAAVPRLQSAITRLAPTDPERYRAQLSLGNCYYRQKQYGPALAAYLDAAKSTDGTVAAEGLYWAANVNLAQDHPGDAASLFGKVAARYPKSELAPRAALKSGDALMAAKESAAAMTAYRAVVDHYPSSPEAESARKALGGVLDSVTDPVQLAAALKNASPGERAKGLVRIARLYLASKHYSEAGASLTELAKLKPDSTTAAEADYLSGIANEGLAHAAPAAAAFAEALRLNGSADWALDAQGRLAWLYLDLKQPANAEKAATAALALRPDKAAESQARLALVQSQVDLQKWDAALDGCKTLLESNPTPETTSSVLYTQAWIEEKRGHPDDALPIWERLARDYPMGASTAEALIHIGDAHLKSGKYDEAQTYYSKLVADFPKSPLTPEAHFKLGSCLFNSDKASEAAAEFILAADDRNAGDYIPEALYWAGVALDKSGKKEEAIRRLTKLVTLYPKHARTANAKIRLAALNAVKAVGGS